MHDTHPTARLIKSIHPSSHRERERELSIDRWSKSEREKEYRSCIYRGAVHVCVRARKIYLSATTRRKNKQAFKKSQPSFGVIIILSHRADIKMRKYYKCRCTSLDIPFILSVICSSFQIDRQTLRKHKFPLIRGWWAYIPATAWAAWFDSAVLHWLVPLGGPGVAIGQCRSWGITVATVAPAHGADNVVPDHEDFGGPPLPHRGYPMWASKKKIYCTTQSHARVHNLLGLIETTA